MSSRAYRTRGRSTRGEATRAKITQAVHELLAEGAFHTATVDEVAKRAGISRATLYQHFRSRLDLVDGMCERFDANPALLEIRGLVDPRAFIANCVAFWSSEDAVLSQLYGVAAIDPAAADLVERQRRDRRGEVERLVAHLAASGLLREGVTKPKAVATLMVTTSYDTYRELRAEGLSDKQVTAFLQDSAAPQLLKST
jgi:AcrR family transcriptional regulator